MFETVGLDGKTKKLDFPKGSKTLLLFFQSGCPHCHRMIPEWNRAFQSKPAGLNVYGVLMDKEPPGFFILMPVEFPVIRAPGKELLNEMRVYRVPTMVRLAGGKVEDVAMGDIDRMRVSQMFRP